MLKKILSLILAGAMLLPQFTVFAQTETEAETEITVSPVERYTPTDSMTLYYSKWVNSDTVSKMKFTYQTTTHNGLFVKEHKSIPYRRWSYIKFDISGTQYEDVSNAVLSLKSFGDIQYTDDLCLYEVTSDWSTDEFKTLTNTNPPTTGNDIVGTCNIPAGSGGSVYEADVTAFIKSALAAGKTEISFKMMMKTAHDTSGVHFYSENSPQATDYTDADPASNVQVPTLSLYSKGAATVTAVKVDGPDKMYQIANGSTSVHTYTAMAKSGSADVGEDMPDEGIIWKIFGNGEDITEDTSKADVTIDGKTLKLALKAPLSSLEVRAISQTDETVYGSIPVTLCTADAGLRLPTEEDYLNIINNVRNKVTGGENFYQINDICAEKVKNIETSAQSYWDSMVPVDEFDAKSTIWTDLQWLNSTTDLKARVSAHITNTFARLSTMATAYAIDGSSLKGNEQLKEDILSAMDWMVDNIYNFEVYWSTRYYTMSNGGRNNWYNWEISAPAELINICCLLYYDVPIERISKYTNSVKEIIAEPKKDVYRSRYSAAANRMWMCAPALVQGAIDRDPVRVLECWDALAETMVYAGQWDGFYKDGSFVEHGYYYYIGGYAISLLQTLSEVLYYVKGTAFEYHDENRANVINWIYDSFDPSIYRGASMDIGRGRAVGRHNSSDHIQGHDAIMAIACYSENADEADKSKIASMVKGWIYSDTYLSIDYNKFTPFQIMAMTGLLNREEEPRTDYNIYKQLPRVDRAILQKNDFAVGLGMYSNSRTKNFSAINGESLKGYNISSGATYLYNDDLAQYGETFWATVDKFRIPGTTSVYGATMAADEFNGSNYAGGVAFDGDIGTSAMILKPQNQNMTAQKSWFMFDDKIVAMGTVTSTNGGEVETIVENRRLNGNKTVTTQSGEIVASVGETADVSGNSWVHLQGNTSQNSDIGYYFPGGGSIVATKQHQSARWSEMNNYTYPAGDPEVSDDYFTMYFSHGTAPENSKYEYVILPNKSAEQVKAYAASPDIKIVKNTDKVHAIKETTSNTFGANFFANEKQTAGIITSYNQASVMLKENDGNIRLYVSDPTQANSQIKLQLAKTLVNVGEKSDEVTVASMDDCTEITVNTSGAKGSGSYVSLDVEDIEYTVGEIILSDENGESISMDISSLPESVYAKAECMNYTEAEIPVVLISALYNSKGKLCDVVLSEQKTLLPGENMLEATLNTKDYPDGLVKAFMVNGFESMKPVSDVVKCPYAISRITALEDTYVEGGSSADTNFGTAEHMFVKYQQGVTDEKYFRKAFLKFNLKDIEKAKNIILRLNSTGTYSWEPTLGIYAVEDNSWSEASLTWNTAPELGELIASFNLPVSPSPVSVDVDLTAHINAAIASGKDVITLAIYIPNTTTLVPTISTKEAGDDVAPALIMYR